MLWLCEATIVQQIGEARARAAADQIDRAEAYGRRDEESLVRVEGNVARIPVAGTLTKKPDFFAMFFGGGNTTYAALQRAVMTAAGNPAVKQIVLDVDSYGGAVDGLFETLDLIDGVRQQGKKMTAVVENAQSAAYAIAAATGRIEARGDGATVGSIGTAVSYWVSPNVVDITNSDSPNKRPDVRTEEGKKVVVEYLDQINDIFVGAIARGRGVGAETVRERFGRGASFTATAAPKGMVDAIIKPALRGSGGKKAMSEEQEKTTQAQLDAAVQRGVTQERDRVLAHLTMGETSGDMKVAVEAIRAGTGMTLELQARYMAAGMNRADAQKRQQSSNADEKALATSETPAATGDLGDQVVAILSKKESFVRA